LRIGYFDQQQLEVLDLDASPLLHLQRLTPTAREQTILDFLGGFNFKGDQARETIRLFSGGEKARLALAMVVWQDPNVLILDEPTNHLDLDMRHALAMALQGYTGAIVLVSHDRHLMRHVVETLWLVQDGSVSEYAGDLAAYEHWVLAGDTGTDEAPEVTQGGSCCRPWKGPADRVMQSDALGCDRCKRPLKKRRKRSRCCSKDSLSCRQNWPTPNCMKPNSVSDYLRL
jgi:ATP-binding cassette subfamily F protein 3